jgi:Tol biopolymer transport system component/tRNA A-37 threonylcarbamoyl transferase component Bud32
VQSFPEEAGMTPERWAQIKGILNAVLERPKQERRAFLDEACGVDAALREEVERLLIEEDAASLEGPGAGLRNRSMPPELSSGEMLAHYRIEAKVGEGGMGVVYRARDSKLGRDVALKVLPEALASDAEYMARFHREAKVLASLNHPNIATIHGLEANAIVMEMVEGATLAERMAKGAIPVEEALAIARQIVEALEYAHERGVIHRDLKPANVKITPDGAVKVLDFGLAKMVQPEGWNSKDAAVSLQTARTGTIAGTPAYMAPEQADGEPVDRRVDVWAFGVVLYEMLTGHRLFDAGSISDTLAAVLTKDPDWSRLPKDTPGWVKRLLRRCLERDKKKRLRDLGDAWANPEMAFEEPVAAARGAQPAWIVAAAFGLIAVVALWAFWRASQAPTGRWPVRFDIDVMNFPASIAVSPDGRRVAFRAGGGPLLMRRLDQDSITPLSGTEGGQDPFFSPDGRWLGFFAGRKLCKILLGGGVPVTLCDARNGRGGSWGQDGYIVASLDANSGLSRVPANGGKPELITGLPGEIEDAHSHRWPQVLPHGRGVLFTSAGGGQYSLWVLKAGSTRPKLLLKNARDGRYMESGYLVYCRQGSLIAAPMDLDRLELTGDGVPLVTNVHVFGTVRVFFELSPSGTLVYVRGKPENKRVVSWLDSAGRTEPLLSFPQRYLTPRLSPDGKRLAVAVEQGDGANVWVYDWSRGTMTAMPEGGEYQFHPVWTPDGEYLVFQSQSRLAWTRSDGTGRVEHLAGIGQAYPRSFSPDGGRLFFHQSMGGNYHIWDTTREQGGASFGPPRCLTEDPGMENYPAISPDGKWLAYSGQVEQGSMRVYVVSLLPDGRIGSGKWQVSNGVGTEPIWAKNERNLFYRSGGKIMVVSYTAKGNVFVPEKPRMWWEKRMSYGGGQSVYDVSPDGKRIVALFDVEDDSAKFETHLRVVLNVDEEIRRRATAGGN